jgi:hypothetical protein
MRWATVVLRSVLCAAAAPSKLPYATGEADMRASREARLAASYLAALVLDCLIDLVY